jgi:xanthine dehydrogenase YagS FAD-binding subunit
VISFIHMNAHSIHEACTTLAAYGGKARLNGGGTDLLSMLKKETLSVYPEALINVKSIPNLDYIEEDNDLLRIGALARLSDLAKSSLIQEKYRVLAEAARSVATPQVRNVATVGGNLCQDVRCWYYRYPRVIGGPITCARKGSDPCFAVKGDNRYHAILGGKKCFAVCPSDLAVAIAALDGTIAISNSKSKRKISVTDFYHPLGNALKGDEMMTGIEIPESQDLLKQKFLKFTLRNPIDFAIVSVAIVMAEKNGVCTDVRIALGAVAPGPVRARKAEEYMIGQPLTEETVAQAAELALSEARPLRMNGYKIDIAKTLVKRSIKDSL